MTKFGKCTKVFSSNKIASKTFSIVIVVSTKQLAKLIKTRNTNQINERVCKFDLIAQKN